VWILARRKKKWGEAERLWRFRRTHEAESGAALSAILADVYIEFPGRRDEAVEALQAGMIIRTPGDVRPFTTFAHEQTNFRGENPVLRFLRRTHPINRQLAYCVIVRSRLLGQS